MSWSVVESKPKPVVSSSSRELDSKLEILEEILILNGDPTAR